MKIGDRVFVRGYIDEIRKDTVIIRNAGGYFGTIPSEVITGELSSAQPELNEWCHDCKEYDKEHHCCPRWNRVIKTTLADVHSEQQWIPCGERLPEENGQYLITVKYEHVDDYEDIYSEHGEWVDGKWDMFSFGHCGKVENIIAWMPLPEPYKEAHE